MSRLTNLLYCAVIILSFLGCSFAKDGQKSQEDTGSIAVKPRSQTQDSILAAVKNGDSDRLRYLVSVAGLSDFDFSEAAQTPFSVALREKNTDIIKELVALGFNPAHLGEAIGDFSNLSFAISEYNVSKRLGMRKLHIPTPNEAELFLYTHLNGIIERTVGEKNQSLTGRIQRASCEMFEEQMMLQKILKPSLNWSDMRSLIESEKCSGAASNRHLRVIYQLELTNQFQGLFSDKDLLKYIMHHYKFTDQMWNIDGSSIWVSPSVLYRVAHQKENLEKFHKGKDTKVGALDVGAFVNELGIEASQFDIVASSPRGVVKTFRYNFLFSDYFMTNFISLTSNYMHGSALVRLGNRGDSPLELYEVKWTDDIFSIDGEL